jgi:uncharacterized membrane protein YgdD (TMEM256/DUF423 family)
MNPQYSQRSWWFVIGAVLGGLAVVTGAFGAHGLPAYLQLLYEGDATRVVHGEEVLAWKKYLGDFQTAAEYQMYHAGALCLVGLLRTPKCERSRRGAGWSFLLGTILFSGSLYALVLSKQTWLGAITPIGGVLFIVGWFALAYAACPAGGACAGPEECATVPLDTR